MRGNRKHVRIYCGQRVAESARQNTVAQFPFVDSTGTVAESMRAKSLLDEIEKENVETSENFKKFPPRVARKDVVRGFPFVDMKGTAKTTIVSDPVRVKKERITIPVPITAVEKEEEKEEVTENITKTPSENMRNLIISSGTGSEEEEVVTCDSGTEFALRLLPSSRVEALRAIFKTVKGRGLSSLHLLDTLQSMGLSVTPVMLQECLYSVGVRCPIQHFNDFAAIYASISLRTSHTGSRGRVSAHEAMLRDFVGDVSYRAVRAAFKRAVKKNRIASDENERVASRPGPRIEATKQQLKASRISVETACDLLRVSLPSYVPVIRKKMRKFFYKRRRSSPSSGVDFVDVLRAYSHLQRSGNRWREVAPQRAPVDPYEASRQARSRRRVPKKEKDVRILALADEILDRFGGVESSSSKKSSPEFSPEESAESSNPDSSETKKQTGENKKTKNSTVQKSTRRAIAWSFDPSGPRNVVIRDTPRQQKTVSSNQEGRSLFATFEAYIFFIYFSTKHIHTHTHLYYSGSESPFSSMSEDVTVGDDVSSMMAPSEIFLEQSEWLGPSSEAEEE